MSRHLSTKLIAGLFSFACLAIATAQAYAEDAPKERSLCVYDPGGESGDFYSLMKTYTVDVLALKGDAAASRVKFMPKVYQDEQTAFDDFKANKCHAVVITGTRARALVPFTGTLEAMGALPSYKMLKRVIKTLSSPRASKLMKSGAYETAGIVPGGAVYLYVRDRQVDTVKELAGRKIATLSFDKAAKTMVNKVGASMISAEISNFAGMFNNKTVDACYAPAFAYKALELFRGVGTKGGVIKYPLAQVTFQVIIRSADFPEGFGKASRKIVAGYANKSVKAAQKAERKIKRWIEIPDADKASYDEMFLNVRVELKNNKVYNGRALKLMRKLRCKLDPSRSECVDPRE